MASESPDNLRVLRDHFSCALTGVRFHPTAFIIAAASFEGEIHVMDLKTLERIASWAPDVQSTIAGAQPNEAGNEQGGADADVPELVDEAEAENISRVREPAAARVDADEEANDDEGNEDEAEEANDDEGNQDEAEEVNDDEGNEALFANPRVYNMAADGNWTVSFSKDGKCMLAGNPNGYIGVWPMFEPNSEALKRFWVLPPLQDEAESLVLISFVEGSVEEEAESSPKKRIVSLSSSGSFCLYEVNDSKAVRLKSAEIIPFHGIISASMTHDGRLLLVGGKGGYVTVYQILANESDAPFVSGPIRVDRVCQGSIQSIECHPHSKSAVFYSKNGLLGALDVERWAVNPYWKHSLERITFIRFSPQGDLVATISQKGNTIHIWRWNDGVCLKEMFGHDFDVSQVDFSADQDFLASSSEDQSCRIWRVYDYIHTNMWSVPFVCSEAYILAPYITLPIRWQSFEKNSLLTVSRNTGIHVWSYETRSPVSAVSVEFEGDLSVATLHDELHILIVGTELGHVHQINPITGKDHVLLKLTQCPVRAVSCHPMLPVYAVLFEDGLCYVVGFSNTPSIDPMPVVIERVCQIFFCPKRVEILVAITQDGRMFEWNHKEKGGLLERHSLPKSCIETIKNAPRHTNDESLSDLDEEGSEPEPHSEDDTNHIGNSTDPRVDGADSGSNPIVSSDAQVIRQQQSSAGNHFDSNAAQNLSRDYSAIQNISKLNGEDNCTRVKEYVRNRLNLNPPLSVNHEGSVIATAEPNFTVKLWSAKTGVLIGSLLGHTDLITSISFSPDHPAIVTTSLDCNVILWSLLDLKPVKIISDNSSAVLWGSVMENNTVITSSDQGVVRIYNLSKFSLAMTLIDTTDTVRCSRISPDGRFLLACSFSGQTTLWNLHDFRSLATFSSNNPVAYSCCFLNDATPNVALIGYDNGAIEIYQIIYAEETNTVNIVGMYPHTINAHMEEVWWIGSSPSGKYVASASGDKSVVLWDPKTWAKIHEFSGHKKEVFYVTFNPDETMLCSGSNDNTARIWDLNTRQCLIALEIHTRAVWCCEYSPDGKELTISSDDGLLSIWNTSTFKLEKVLAEHTRGIGRCMYSRDGHYLVSSSDDQTIKIWDMEKKECLHTFQGHSHWIWSCEFSKDDRFIVTTSVDRKVQIRSLEQILPPFHPHVQQLSHQHLTEALTYHLLRNDAASALFLTFIYRPKVDITMMPSVNPFQLLRYMIFIIHILDTKIVGMQKNMIDLRQTMEKLTSTKQESSTEDQMGRLSVKFYINKLEAFQSLLRLELERRDLFCHQLDLLERTISDFLKLGEAETKLPLEMNQSQMHFLCQSTSLFTSDIIKPASSESVDFASLVGMSLSEFSKMYGSESIGDLLAFQTLVRLCIHGDAKQVVDSLKYNWNSHMRTCLSTRRIIHHYESDVYEDVYEPLQDHTGDYDLSAEQNDDYGQNPSDDTNEARNKMLLAKPIHHWNPTNVFDWLTLQKMSHHAPMFLHHRINGFGFLSLSSSDLRDYLGVTLLSERKKIQTEIASLIQTQKKANKLPENVTALKSVASYLSRHAGNEHDDPHSTHYDNHPCCLCYSSISDILFLPCKHLCICKKCSQSLDKCPYCRSAIQKRQLIFWPVKL